MMKKRRVGEMIAIDPPGRCRNMFEGRELREPLDAEVSGVAGRVRRGQAEITQRCNDMRASCKTAWGVG